MFARKLKALDYPRQGFFNINDETAVRHLVIWLEDTIFNTELPAELTNDLRNTSHPSWNAVFTTYLKQCLCPFDAMDRCATVDWLLREAIRLVISDGQYDIKLENNREKVEIVDWNSTAFREGTMKMAAMLNLPRHHSPAILLKSIAILFSQHLSTKEESGSKEDFLLYPLDEVTVGFDNQDNDLKTVCGILRLLHINQLRKLQTQMDTALVAVQAITANPQTDAGLGRTGF